MGRSEISQTLIPLAGASLIGGTIGGDDIHYKDVLNDVKKFTKENNIEITYSHNGFKVIK